MAIKVLDGRADGIARALHAASLTVGAQTRPLKVAAFHLDSAADIQRAYAMVKQELGAVEVVVLPAPVHLDPIRHARMVQVLKSAGVPEANCPAVVANLIQQLT